jgi:hypothetical protein
LEKPDSLIEHSGYSGFDTSRVNIRGRENMRKLEIEVCLRHGKGEKASESKKQKRLKPKAKATKTRCSGFGFRMVWFFLNR